MDNKDKNPLPTDKEMDQLTNFTLNLEQAVEYIKSLRLNVEYFTVVYNSIGLNGNQINFYRIKQDDAEVYCLVIYQTISLKSSGVSEDEVQAQSGGINIPLTATTLNLSMYITAHSVSEKHAKLGCELSWE